MLADQVFCLLTSNSGKEGEDATFFQLCCLRGAPKVQWPVTLAA